MSDWKPYPAYKPSGVEWLGDIPTHWEVKRLKNVTALNPETLAETTDPDYVLQYLDISNVDEVSGINPPEEMHFENAPSRARRIVRAGDTILSTVRTYLKAIAYFDAPPENLIVSTGFAVLRPKHQVLPQFLHVLVRCREFIETVVAYSTGVGYPAINPTALSCLPVWLPPIDEQRAIAAFLDRETAKLDALIAKHERLIELLQEKRTALISHAVTKGLDPSVPMKDSGVPWLGRIPVHWETLLLKRTANIRYGLGQPPPEMIEGAPLVRATNIKSGHIFDEGMIYVDPAEVPAGRNAVLSEGEIIVVRSGAYTGDSAIIPTKYLGAISGYDLVVTIREGYSPFFAWQFHCPAVRDLQFIPSSLRAAQPHLNAEELGETIIAVPPLPEQCAIAAYLDHETAKLDALIAKVRASIEKLREYRSALISAAVTGKIDVRSA